MKLEIPSLLLLLSAVTQPVSASCKGPNAKVSKVWEFPVGYFVENLAVRQNGYILTTIITHPEVYQVDPSRKEAAALVVKIPQKLSVAGITETTTDKFYVVAGNASFQPFSLGSGTFSVYELDLARFVSRKTLRPRLIADFTNAGFLNGMTTLDAERGVVLVADSTEGAVWRLNVNSGEKRKIITDPLMEMTSFAGINGVKIADNYLYWTNTDMQIIARAPISASGVATGPGEIVANVTTPDDLLPPDSHGRGFVAGNNAVRQFEGPVVSTVSNRTLLAGSTAVVFAPAENSRGSRDLYLSTNGGEQQYFDGNVTVPGKVVKVHC